MNQNVCLPRATADAACQLLLLVVKAEFSLTLVLKYRWQKMLLMNASRQISLTQELQGGWNMIGLELSNTHMLQNEVQPNREAVELRICKGNQQKVSVYSWKTDGWIYCKSQSQRWLLEWTRCGHHPVRVHIRTNMQIESWLGSISQLFLLSLKAQISRFLSLLLQLFCRLGNCPALVRHL